MLEEDVRSRYLRRKDREDEDLSRKVPLRAEKYALYSRIIDENVALKESLRIQRVSL